jgi:hypothetical protein
LRRDCRAPSAQPLHDVVTVRKRVALTRPFRAHRAHFAPQGGPSWVMSRSAAEGIELASGTRSGGSIRRRSRARPTPKRFLVNVESDKTRRNWVDPRCRHADRRLGRDLPVVVSKAVADDPGDVPARPRAVRAISMRRLPTGPGAREKRSSSGSTRRSTRELRRARFTVTTEPCVACSPLRSKSRRSFTTRVTGSTHRVSRSGRWCSSTGIRLCASPPRTPPDTAQ